MTERDKKLLVFLASFLIIVGFAVLVFLPGMEKIDALNLEVDEAVETQQEMEIKVASLLQMNKNYEDTADQYQKAVKDFYPLMKSQEVDRLLTEIVLKCGLTATQLNIVMPGEPVVLTPYVGSALALEEEDRQEDGSEENADADDSTGSSADADADESTDSLADADADDPEDAADESEAKSLVYAADISLTVKGTQENTRRLLDQLSGYPAIRLCGFQTENSTSDEDEAEGEITRFSLALYMCEKEGAE